MAIARGAGTEIIRSASFYDCSSATNTKLIIGVQHHIYTVLNITVYAIGSYTPFTVSGILHGYDADNGTSGVDMIMFKNGIQAGESFVFNDKFSFNGFEPTNFTGPMDDATKQDAIADQGSSVAQYLYIYTSHAADDCDVSCTYIDQNNS